MSISFKLKIFASVIIFVTFIFSYSFWQTSQDLQTQGETNKLTQTLIQNIFEFESVTTEYLNSQNIQADTQWKNNHAALKVLLNKISSKIYTDDDVQSLEKIISSDAQVDRTINSLSSNNTSTIKYKEELTDLKIRPYIKTMLSEAYNMSKRSLNRLTEAEQKLRNTSSLLLLIYIVFFIVGLAILILKILNPITKLQHSAEQLALGDYSIRIPESGKDEISALATSYNKLASEIQTKINSLIQQSETLTHSRKELIRLNTNLQSMVDEQTSVLKNSENKHRAILESMSDGIITLSHNFHIQEINSAITKIFGYTSRDAVNRKINFIISDIKGVKINSDVFYEKQGLHKKGINFPIEITLNEMIIDNSIMYNCIVRNISERKITHRMQVEFVSNISHELRTPLTSIRGALGLLNSGVLKENPDKTEELLATAYNNTERLMNVINDLLDMQKIDAGKLNFNIKQVNLTEAMNKVMTENMIYAGQRNVNIDFIETDSNLMINVDPQRLDQIMSNLLSNAVKFSYKNTSVLISTTIKGSYAKVSVIDSGEGIPKDFFDTIFDKFTQNDASATRAKGGTGLGLAITKQMIESMAGAIDFSSIVGEGTTFNIYIPLVK